jgi:hypothetical protein
LAVGLPSGLRDEQQQNMRGLGKAQRSRESRPLKRRWFPLPRDPGSRVVIFYPLSTISVVRIVRQLWGMPTFCEHKGTTAEGSTAADRL